MVRITIIRTYKFYQQERKICSQLAVAIYNSSLLPTKKRKFRTYFYFYFYFIFLFTIFIKPILPSIFPPQFSYDVFIIYLFFSPTLKKTDIITSIITILSSYCVDAAGIEAYTTWHHRDFEIIRSIITGRGGVLSVLPIFENLIIFLDR